MSSSPTPMADLAKADKLLIAAARLDAREQSEFTAEDLVVEAFKAFPNDFSLKGYPAYPDNNSVYTLLMGKSARLVASGWLEKTGAKKYRLTPKGMHDAAQRDPNFADLKAKQGALRSDRRLEEGLARLFQSDAFESFRRSGSTSEVTFHQFCRFMGLAAPDSWQKVQGKLETVRHLVEYARKIGESGQTASIHFRGATREYSVDDLMLLKALFDDLARRFKPQMAAWESKARLK